MGCIVVLLCRGKPCAYPFSSIMMESCYGCGRNVFTTEEKKQRQLLRSSMAQTALKT